MIDQISACLYVTTHSHTNVYPHNNQSPPAPTIGWLHPTINLDSPEEGVDPIMVVANVKQQ